MENTKVGELTLIEFKRIIRDIITEAIEELGYSEFSEITYVDDEEQKELEAMFGKQPEKEEYVLGREIEL
ncbi:hypothetical protein IPdc08_01221 [archaeon]|nr:hypothetical protein IPdc08_01221 [archaeon]